MQDGMNVRYWLTSEVPTASAPRPVYPRQQTFEVPVFSSVSVAKPLFSRPVGQVGRLS